jgi:aspartyl-tRNA(Asn)/glutamyl-tRNA(Gln) amidotransferase subunit B
VVKIKGKIIQNPVDTLENKMRENMKDNSEKYEIIIGLETHIQLNTTTKIFCSCKADSWESPPNTNICPVCTGLPGVLPVLNQVVVEKGARLAAAMHAKINPLSYFDRKNYFYPDLPKGYQISQFDKPLANGGYLDIPIQTNDQTYLRRVNIHKLHIEEDAGKTKTDQKKRLIDFNRCGVPLVEMVTAPDLRTPEEAAQYLFRLRQLLRWIGVSEADMEKGHLRCDANVSIRPFGVNYFNPKTEIKNVNSISSVRTAIQTEVARQIREVEVGNRIEAWTLEWDEDQEVLRKMRSKETEADYRYFREPDLLPVILDTKEMERIYTSIPELPMPCRERFMDFFKLPEYDADILTNDRHLAEYFENAVDEYKGDPKKVSNWIINDVLRITNELGIQIDQLEITPVFLAQIILMVDSGTINNATGKALLEKVQKSGKSPTEIVEKENLTRVSDQDSIKNACQQVIDENPGEVEKYKSGKDSLIGWFVGQVMRKSKGKADPKITHQIFEELLNK